MQINFNDIQEMTMPGMNNGTGLMTVKMYNDDKYRIIPTVIHAGGSIGLHAQNSGDDMNYITVLLLRRLNGICRSIFGSMFNPVTTSIFTGSYIISSHS